MSTLSRKKFKRSKQHGIFKNPFLHFGLGSFLLFGLLLTGSNSLAKLNNTIPILTPTPAVASANNNLFFSQNTGTTLETPELKITGDGFVAAVTTPNIVNHQTLGMIFGEPTTEHGDANKVREYEVQTGDTVESIAQYFNISTDTILLVNDFSGNTSLKAGDTLTILPVSGLIHVVKSGDTISGLSKTYKSKIEEIVAFNALSSENDIFIGDTLVIPNGVMPAKSAPSSTPSSSLVNGFFNNPTTGKVTQRLHYYNAVDVANTCGTPIYAAASGTVQRAVANGAWNGGKGNYATILHSNGVVTYYGHFTKLYIGVGDTVNAGDTIGLMGSTGDTTGCNLHFQALGSKNPLAGYLLGAFIK